VCGVQGLGFTLKHASEEGFRKAGEGFDAGGKELPAYIDRYHAGPLPVKVTPTLVQSLGLRVVDFPCFVFCLCGLLCFFRDKGSGEAILRESLHAAIDGKVYNRIRTQSSGLRFQIPDPRVQL